MDLGCLSRIPVSDFYPSRTRIPDPKTATIFVVIPFFVATNFTKFKIILFLKCRRKKFGPVFQRIIVLFIQKFVTKLSKIWVWYPGSEIRDPKKTYSGSRIRVQGSKRHWIPDPDPQICVFPFSGIAKM